MTDPADLRDVFDRAASLPPQDREAFLARACGDDAALRREVERLLAADARAGSMFDSQPGDATDEPAPPAPGPRPPTLTAGTRLGPYQIEAPLGAGGMGEVYRARDTRLGRIVALKVLLSEFSHDPVARQRFEREARAVAALSDPHICPLFDVGRDGDVDYLVMECLQGETLAARLRRSRLRLREALTIGLQIASGLAAAHRAGIVHRDLKPGNVMLTASGVRLLDFGLARHASPEPGDGTTLTAPDPLTGTGMILGTLPYMAPEQIEGHPVDARTDIFAFGVVLYEMVTGRRAFEATSQAAVAGQILCDDPPSLTSLDPALPPALDRLIRRCIAKEPADRWPTMSDAQARLEALQETTDPAASATAAGTVRTRPSSDDLPPHQPARRSSTTLAGASVLILGSAFLAWVWWAKSSGAPQVPHPEPQLVRLTANPADRSVTSAVISPDGRYVAYGDPLGLALRQSDTGDTQRLPDTREMSVYGWTADSANVLAGICQGGKCAGWTVSIIAGTRRPNGAVWEQGDEIALSPDGLRLLRRAASGHVFIDPLNGLPPLEIATLARAVSWDRDGRHVFLVRADGSGIDSISDGGSVPESVFVAAEGQEIDQVAQIHDGRVVAVMSRLLQSSTFFGRERSIWDLGTRVDHTARSTSGGHRLTDWRNSESPQLLSVTADGKRLCFLNAVDQWDAYVAGFDPRTGLSGEPRRLTFDDRFDLPTAWTPDSSSVLFYSTRNGTSDIFRQRIDSDIAEPLVVGLGDQAQPRVSGDGHWLLFQEVGAKAMSLMRVPLSGGTPRRIPGTEDFFVVHCAGQGRCVLLDWRGPDVIVWSLDPVEGRGAELVRLPAALDGADVSPDGDALAYLSAAQPGPRNAIRVVSFHDRSERTIAVPGVSGLEHLEWLPDGSGFISSQTVHGHGTLLFIKMDGRSQSLWSPPPQLIPLWAVPSPDGKHLAIAVIARQSNVWMMNGI